MIIKSHIRGGFRDAASYLKEQGFNEKTRLVEIGVPQAKNLDQAFKSMWAIADGTKVKKPLHHVSINPMKDERLSDQQVFKICEHLEDKYGYTHGKHQRVIVEHIRDGRQHFHVIWNRVNIETGKPHYPYMHIKQSKIAAREIEVMFNLRKPVSRHKQVIPFVRSIIRFEGKTITNGFSELKYFKPIDFSFYPSKTFLFCGTVRYQPQPQYNEPIRSPRPEGMCEEEYLDFIAACEGKITWRQYFKRWGEQNLSL